MDRVSVYPTTDSGQVTTWESRRMGRPLHRMGGGMRWNDVVRSVSGAPPPGMPSSNENVT